MAAAPSFDPLADYGPIAKAVVQVFVIDPPPTRDGHHVRKIFDGVKKLAPEGLHGSDEEQLEMIACVFPFFFFLCPYVPRVR